MQQTVSSSEKKMTRASASSVLMASLSLPARGALAADRRSPKAGQIWATVSSMEAVLRSGKWGKEYTRAAGFPPVAAA